MEPNELCREVLGTGRGDEHDPPWIAEHIATCAACSNDLSAFRSIAGWARATLVELPLRGGLAQAILERVHDGGALWITPARCGVSFASAVAVMGLMASLTSPARNEAGIPRLASIEVSVPQSEPSRVSFRLVDPSGVDRREIDLDSRYEVDVVPATAIVVDTF